MSHLYFSLIFDLPVDIDKYPRHTLLKLFKLCLFEIIYLLYSYYNQVVCLLLSRFLETMMITVEWIEWSIFTGNSTLNMWIIFSSNNNTDGNILLENKYFYFCYY